MKELFLHGEIIPSSEISYEIGQRVFDALTNKVSTISALIGRSVIVETEQAEEVALRKKNLHWVGNHWVNLPRPWIVTVEDWDGRTYIAQFHETQTEAMVDAASDKEVALKFQGRGLMTLFKLQRMIIRLDSVALINGLMHDLSENGAFGSTLDLTMSRPTLKETLSPKIRHTLIDSLDKAWDQSAPEGIWWAIGGVGETWCCNCAMPVLRCSC